MANNATADNETAAAVANNNSIVAMESLNNVATWVSATFFSSLERFSCVNVATFDDDNEEEASDRPLTLSTHPYQSDDISDLPVRRYRVQPLLK